MRVVLVALALVLTACTSPGFVHEEQRASFSSDKTSDTAVAPVLSGVRIALLSGPETDLRLERHVANALLRTNAVVDTPPFGDFHADYQVELHVKRRVTGCGKNFLIAWPGFLIFAPLWHGFEWPYRVDTLAVITRPDGSEVVSLWRGDLYTAYATPPSYAAATSLTGCPAGSCSASRSS